ncbi:MAG: sulfatase-like hydrolase/transferase [Acidobacteria bacterium]|nr:sulfatase-like hydrolase/transferase [Acidobacteriota bacterium]
MTTRPATWTPITETIDTLGRTIARMLLPPSGWLQVSGEGACMGLLGGGVIAAWQSRLQQDLSHGTLWLAMERSLHMLFAGAMAGLLISVGTLLLFSVGRRERSGSTRVIILVAGGLALVLTVPFLQILRAGVLALLPWTSGKLAMTAYTVIILAAAILIFFRARDGNSAGRRAPMTLVPRVMAVGGLALLSITGAGWVGLAPLHAARARGRPSVILISLDTLRADRLGFMGYPRATTTRLDEMAAQGMVFENAISPAPWTLPAHVSLLTSQLPNEHRVRQVGSRVRPHHLILSECFRDAGYRTAAFTGGGYVSRDYGYKQGFQVYQDHDEKAEGGPGGIAQAALEWVRDVGDQPFFLFVHTYEPHGPYLQRDFVRPEDRGRLTDQMIAGEVKSVPDPSAGERRYISDLYDGDITNADRAMGGLLMTLRDEGVLARAIVIVTSDHGEDLWDHDAVDIPRHGHTLYEEVVHVPLLMRAPGLIPAGIRVRTPISLIDLAPTLLGLAGLPPRRSMRGQNMADALRAGNEPEMRPLLSEAVRYGPPRYAWREDGLKVILTPDPAPIDEISSVVPDRLEIFDLAGDPLEQHTLAANPPAGSESAISILNGRAGLEPGNQSDADHQGQTEELKRQLRSLGYVD